jgi:hypothetical protein
MGGFKNIDCLYEYPVGYAQFYRVIFNLLFLLSILYKLRFTIVLAYDLYSTECHITEQEKSIRLHQQRVVN